jgi:TolB protein
MGTLLTVLIATEASAGVDAGHGAIETSAKIAFSSARVFDGVSIHGDRIINFDIYVMNGDGSDPQRLTRQPGVETSPSWSPDGRELIYEGIDVGEDSEIFVMKANGRAQRVLTKGWGGREPSWSPNGRVIAYTTGDTFYDREVWVMNPDGSRRRKLTHGPYDFSPSWSPDSRRIVFSCGGSSSQDDVCVMDADGSHRRRLARTAKSERYPVWSPRGDAIAFLGGAEATRRTST